MRHGPPWNKGKKMPHTPEWEAKRLAAMRKAAKAKPRKRGYTRPREHVQPMLDAVAASRASDPAGNRERAIRNLTRDGSLNLSKENHPKWLGGITKDWQKWKSENGARLERWRKRVVARHGGKCAQCGSTERVQAHHIVPVSASRSFAFLNLNGVPLCLNCHRQTDSFGGKSKGQLLRTNTMMHLESIPYCWHEYETVGNYGWGTEGDLLVLVSAMGDARYEALVGIHEAVEALLCRHRGINDADITAFDMAFEAKREPGNVDEPGDDPAAPYRREHFFATSVERLLAAELGVDWMQYDEAVNAL